MADSPWMGWEYPVRGQAPWYERWKALLFGQDFSAYSCLEDRNTFILGGGGLSFSAASDLLTWDDTLIVAAGMVTGYKHEIVADSLTVEDGEVIYLNLTRGPQANVVATLQTAPRLFKSNRRLAIGIRQADRIYFRNGLVLIDGDISVKLFEWGSRFSGGGGLIPHGASHALGASDPIPGMERIQEVFICTATEAPLDVVYQVSSGTVAQADKAGWPTMPAIGVIESKPSATSCIVTLKGPLPLFGGLTPDIPYYVGTAGSMVSAKPVTPGEISQRIGTASTPTVLYVDPGEPTERV